MRLDSMGESAMILRGIERISGHEAARALSDLNLPGVIEVTGVWDSVGIYFDPQAFDPEGIEDVIQGLEPKAEPPAIHKIPVCFELGPDLEEASENLGLKCEELIHEFVNWEYICQAVGFCPGFPFLGPIPERLKILPRRSQPRTAIEPGSVAIAAGQAGIYPIVRPGGWSLLGQTPLKIVDEAQGWFPISAGDKVLFERINNAEFERLNGKRL